MEKRYYLRKAKKEQVALGIVHLTNIGRSQSSAFPPIGVPIWTMTFPLSTCATGCFPTFAKLELVGDVSISRYFAHAYFSNSTLGISTVRILFGVLIQCRHPTQRTSRRRLLISTSCIHS